MCVFLCVCVSMQTADWWLSPGYTDDLIRLLKASESTV